MTDDCLFCRIVKGEVPASVIFEDEHCMAFMDIFPVSKGHALLIPKKHFTNMLDVDPEVVSYLAKKLTDLTQRIQKAFDPDGILNTVANGAGAGQEVPHLHFHAIPRNRGDKFGFRFPDNYREKMASRDELDETAKMIRESKD